MKRLIFLLSIIWMMVATAPVLGAQESPEQEIPEYVKFISKPRGVTYKISTMVLIQRVENGEEFVDGEIADNMMEKFAEVSPSSGANEPAVLILKSIDSNEWFFIQFKPDGYQLHSFWIYSEEFGWMRATRKTLKQLEALIPDTD